MITPNMAVAICTIINLCLTVINFMLITKLNHAVDKYIEVLEEDKNDE